MLQKWVIFALLHCIVSKLTCRLRIGKLNIHIYEIEKHFCSDNNEHMHAENRSKRSTRNGYVWTCKRMKGFTSKKLAQFLACLSNCITRVKIKELSVNIEKNNPGRKSLQVMYLQHSFHHQCQFLFGRMLFNQVSMRFIKH